MNATFHATATTHTSPPPPTRGALLVVATNSSEKYYHEMRRLKAQLMGMVSGKSEMPLN